MRTFILTTIGVMICAVSIAQFQYGNWCLGYQSGNKKMDIWSYKFLPASGGSDMQYIKTKPRTLNIKSFPIWLEAMAPNFYIQSGVNIPKLTTDDEVHLNIREHNEFMIKFAAGPSFKKLASLQVGLQWEWRLLDAGKYEPDTLKSLTTTGSNKNEAAQYYVDYQGGAHYGFNLNFLVTASRFFCFRASLFDNYVRFKGIPGNSNFAGLQYKGKSIDEEVALYLYLPNKKERQIFQNLGLKLQYTHEHLNIQCNDTEGKTYVPDNITNSNYFSISLILGKVMPHKNY